jgi:hypothetical protein
MEIRFKISSSFFGALTALLKTFLLLIIFLAVAIFSSCKKEFDYLPYVSELRSNILLTKTEDFSVRIYAVKKENPYTPDGIPHEGNTRIEVYVSAPEGKDACRFFFTFDGQEYGGEMSYDNVKAEYFYACTLDVSKVQSLPCRIEYGAQTLNLTALSIRQDNTLSAEEILKKLKNAEGELFENMTDKYGFAGEIYIRLIYEENPYYYVGIIDKEGKINAFLLNAQTGKILAKRIT